MDVSDFVFFFSRGGERGSLRRREGGGDRFFIENPRRAGGSPAQEGPRGRESVCGELGNLGGGAKYFFSGPKCPPRQLIR